MNTHIRLLVLCSGIALGAGCGSNARNAGTPPDAPPPPGDAPAADPTLVTTGDGPVKGSIVGTSRQFLGIPYAKPPIGDLRWKAPQAPDPWTTPRDATAFGKRCAQLANAVLQNAASSDEDCLYLNVWTPSPAPAAAAPVMVWIHGGGNVNGSASEPVPFVNSGLFYTGEFLAENQGVIVVSLNYRLGIFGFYAHPSLAAEGTEGNQGLLDQVMAIQWVKNNIAAFGGDPNNVTIFGESAGSLDVCYHVASPLTLGLFQRAISESGGCTTVQTTKAAAETAAAKLATDVGCTGDSALSCMRAKAVADLMSSADVIAGTGFGPDIDGQFLPDQPRTLYTNGQIAKVPYLLGSNNDEGTLFVQGVNLTSDMAYEQLLDGMFPSVLPTTKKSLGETLFTGLYQPANFVGVMPNADMAAYARVVGDSILVCSTFDSAQRMMKQSGAAVFMYNFNIPIPSTVDPMGLLRATHGSELTYVFGTDPLFAADPNAKAASTMIQQYWANFARTGDPNSDPSLPSEGTELTWPAFTASQNIRMTLALTPGVVTDFRAAECALWQTDAYDPQFPQQ